MYNGTRRPHSPMLASLIFAALLAGGCASSERMARLSGGVVNEYSAPQSHRLRSEKFQAKTGVFSSAARTRPTTAELGDLDARLVNIWPFFFSSNAYTAILWPFIDVDDYGLAVRPFYNQEGDEYSVLFPLSAWNAADGSGWVLNTAWGKMWWLFLPLAYHNADPVDGCFWYTPLVIRDWDFNPGSGAFANRRTGAFTEVMLAFYGDKTWRDDSGWEWLFAAADRENSYPDELKREIAYRFAQSGRPIPADAAELAKLRKEVFDRLPEKRETFGGVFPFCFRSTDGENTDLNLLGVLYHYSGHPDRSRHWLLSGLLGYYTIENIASNPADYGHGEKSLLLAGLLSRFARTTVYEDTPEVKAFRELSRFRWQTPFGRYRSEIQTTLQTIDPALKLPPTVTDGNTLGLYLDELAKSRKFPTREEYSGGVLPLFVYDFETPERKWWAAPTLLTGYNRDAQNSLFWSVPLLSYFSESPARDIATVAGPLGYYSKTRRVSKIDKPIHSSPTRWVKESEVAEFQDDYAACGLYYHGRDRFYVVKPGVDSEVLEQVRRSMWDLFHERASLQSRQRQLRKREARANNWQTATRLEQLKRAVELEEIRLDWEKYRSDEKRCQTEFAALRSRCAKLGFALNEQALAERSGLEAELERLFAFGAEAREWEDFGNGLLFRKERYYNGDTHWKVLGGLLAGGRREGGVEETQILHLLYRYRRDGKRSEELIFPFIAIREDGPDRQVSFLWRVYERTEKAGKVSGYFCFFPF